MLTWPLGGSDETWPATRENGGEMGKTREAEAAEAEAGEAEAAEAEAAEAEAGEAEAGEAGAWDSDWLLLTAEDTAWAKRDGVEGV